MRRIALTAALAATLAGGAAALAATPDPAAPEAAPPDPYQGSWALVVDGRFAGPLAQVDGCSVQARVVEDVSGGLGEHVAAAAPQPCAIEFGAGMSGDFYKLVGKALAARPSPQSVQLVRTDPEGGYALDLAHATIAALTVPEIDRASTAPVYLKATLQADRVARIAAPPLTKEATGKARGFSAATLDVRVGGQPLFATSAGPWTAEVKAADGTGETRDMIAPAPTVELSRLPLRVPEASRRAIDTLLDPWVDATMNRGTMDERPVTVALAGLTLTLDPALPVRADLAPRADGARSYDLRADQATVAPS